MRPISRRKLASTLVVAAIALLLGGWKLDSLTCCSGPARPAVAVATATAMPPPTAAASVTREAAPTIERLVPEVISTRPHDTTSFTEGFELIDGVIYESDGLYGESTMRRADPKTGEILTVVDVPPDYFAEGIAVVGDKVIQMTWKEDTAFVYDAETLKQVGTLSYTGEGWGMCYDGESLYQSDGSATIFQRDPTTFAVTGQVDVTFQGQPVNMINELECVGDHLYANIWLTDFIIRLDKTTGVIDGVIDATGLLTPEETTAVGSQGVLNGIAYDPDADTFLITGKLWPKVFEVRFVPFTG